MPVGLSNIIDSYGTIIQAAGFVLLPVASRIRDQANQNKRWYQLDLLQGPALGDVHGSTVVDYDVVLVLELHWNTELDTSIVSSTVANDVESMTKSMLKITGRPSEVLIVTIPRPGGRLGRDRPDDWVWVGEFAVSYRLTLDLT